jgi:hypothetical protein
MMTVFGEISLFEFKFLNNIRFCLFFLKSMALVGIMQEWDEISEFLTRYGCQEF